MIIFLTSKTNQGATQFGQKLPNSIIFIWTLPYLSQILIISSKQGQFRIPFVWGIPKLTLVVRFAKDSTETVTQKMNFQWRVLTNKWQCLESALKVSLKNLYFCHKW